MEQKVLNKYIGKKVAINLKNSKNLLIGELFYETIPEDNKQKSDFFPMTQAYTVRMADGGEGTYFKASDVRTVGVVATEPKMQISYGTGKSYTAIGMLAKAKKGSKK